MSSPVHQEDGKWYFWDETEADRCGPYESEEEANQHFTRYCNEVLGVGGRADPVPDDDRLPWYWPFIVVVVFAAGFGALAVIAWLTQQS